MNAFIRRGDLKDFLFAKKITPSNLFFLPLFVNANEISKHAKKEGHSHMQLRCMGFYGFDTWLDMARTIKLDAHNATETCG